MYVYMLSAHIFHFADANLLGMCIYVYANVSVSLPIQNMNEVRVFSNYCYMYTYMIS